MAGGASAKYSVCGRDAGQLPHPDWDSEPEVDGYIHALVEGYLNGSALSNLAVKGDSAPADIAWTHRKLTEILQPGDIVYVRIVSLDGMAKPG